MNIRDEGAEDDSGWAWECDPSAEWVLGGMSETGREQVRVAATALAD